MGASVSRLTRAGGDRNEAITGLLNDPSPVVAQAKAKYANDPVGFETWVNKKINETTKGKYSGVLGGAVKLVSKAAPLAALIPGVGIPLAAGIGAAGRLAGGEGLKGAVTGAALGAGGAYLTGGKGLAGLTSNTGVLANATSKTGILGKAASKTGILGKAWDYVQKNPLKAAQVGLAGASAIQGAKRQGQSDTLLNNSIARMNQARRPIDLGSTFADPGNPYSTPGAAPNRAARAARSSLGGY